MPLNIKKAVVALILSCISTLIAVYFDGLEYKDISFSDPLTLGINVIWTLIVAWIIWDLIRGKSIKLTLILVGLIMLVSLVWDLMQYGVGVAQIFYAFELLMFVAAYVFIASEESKAWYAKKNL
jgi:uncharacterized membrane protein (UPF0182 family)